MEFETELVYSEFFQAKMLVDQVPTMVSLRADVSYFLCFTREAKEIGDVCTQANHGYALGFSK